MKYNKQLEVTLEEAVELIQKNTKTMPITSIKLGDIYKETLAEDVIAQIDQPPFPRSPLDGYAFCGEDSIGATKNNPVKLKVIETHYAGSNTNVRVRSGEAVRIMTGGVIPQGANAVIRQEDTDYGTETVCLYNEIKPYMNYCFQGEEYKKGTLLVKQGSVLDYTAVGLLASNGIAEVKVRRKPHIFILTTGDELMEPGERLKEGKIYNSNLYLLKARLRELGFECVIKHMADEVTVVAEEILHQLTVMDAVITTGGVSLGEKDIFNEVLPRINAELYFNRVKMKPGSPAKFALVKGKPLLALSGNPFAAATTFELLGRPMLDVMMGKGERSLRKTTAYFENGLQKSSPQRRFLRGIYSNGKVRNPEKNSSGQIRSMMGCNCFIDIADGSGPIEPGKEVDVVLI